MIPRHLAERYIVDIVLHERMSKTVSSDRWWIRARTRLTGLIIDSARNFDRGNVIRY